MSVIDFGNTISNIGSMYKSDLSSPLFKYICKLTPSFNDIVDNLLLEIVSSASENTGVIEILLSTVFKSS